MVGKTAEVLAAAASLAAMTALSSAAAVADGNSATSARGELSVIGVSNHPDQRMLRFKTDQPEQARVLSRVSGLVGDNQLVGIDYRVQDGKLYGVGNSGGIYTLRPFTGKATKVSQLSVALDGRRFGVDFNPAADRLRIVSDTGQNLRHDVNSGGVTTVDGPLAYPATTTTPAVPGAGVTAAAYTNNDLDVSTSTTLFDIDTMLDQVVIQSPANSGQLAATGKLLVDSGSKAGLDIYSRLNDAGRTTGVSAFAVLRVDEGQRLYSIRLLNGAATELGVFKDGQRVVDLALPLDQR